MIEQFGCLLYFRGNNFVRQKNAFTAPTIFYFWVVSAIAVSFNALLFRVHGLIKQPDLMRYALNSSYLNPTPQNYLK